MIFKVHIFLDGRKNMTKSPNFDFESKLSSQVNFSKKRMNEFVFTTMQRIFVHFLEEIEETKKTFRN